MPPGKPIYIYIYIYIERERERDTYIYVYVYIFITHTINNTHDIYLCIYKINEYERKSLEFIQNFCAQEIKGKGQCTKER